MVSWGEVVVKLVMLGVMLVGLFGLVVPVFPGHLVIFVVGLVHGFVFGFDTLGLILFIVLTLLAIAGMLIDNVLMGAKAIQKGAHWTSLAAAMLAGVVGSIFLTPLLGIPLALLGLYLAEWARRKEAQAAWEVTKGMMVGWGWAFVIRFAIGMVMIGVWGIWAVAGMR